MDEILQQLGLTHSQSRVFLSLYELEETTVGPLVESSGVASSKIYPLLEKLKDKGLVSEISKDNVKHFSSVTPRRLLELVNQKEQELGQLRENVENIIPQLEKITLKEKKETKMFEGVPGYAAVLSEILQTVQTKYYVFGATRELSKNELRILQSHLRHVSQKNITVKIIYASDVAMPEKIATFGSTEIRVSPHKHPGTILISDAAIALISWDEPQTQVFIASKSFARMYLDEFEKEWKVAKEK